MPRALAIRPASRADAAAVDATVQAAFGQPDEARLVERLRADGDAAIELVAVEAGGIVGHILFSPLTAPVRALALAPLAVRPDRQRAGIGGGLVRAGLDAARQAGWQAVFVLGDPAYYRRFGFDPALAAGFRTPYDGPHLMALAISGPLPVRAGRVDYARAFATP